MRVPLGAKEYEMREGLNPGDKVIVLAAAATTAAIVAGAATGAIAAWIAKHKVAVSAATLLGGVLVGGIIGSIIGKLLFPALDGNVMIAKWGPHSLPLTLKGNIIASLVTSAVVCGLMTLTVKVEFKAIATLCIGTSVILGVILALLASLV